MKVPHPRQVRPIRNRVISVRAVAELVARLDELETGTAEHLRHAPELDRFLDGLESDVMSLVESRVGKPDDRAAGT